MSSFIFWNKIECNSKAFENWNASWTDSNLTMMFSFCEDTPSSEWHYQCRHVHATETHSVGSIIQIALHSIVSWSQQQCNSKNSQNNSSHNFIAIWWLVICIDVRWHTRCRTLRRLRLNCQSSQQMVRLTGESNDNWTVRVCFFVFVFFFFFNSLYIVTSRHLID